MVGSTASARWNPVSTFSDGLTDPICYERRAHEVRIAWYRGGGRASSIGGAVTDSAEKRGPTAIVEPRRGYLEFTRLLWYPNLTECHRSTDTRGVDYRAAKAARRDGHTRKTIRSQA
jgi:hypothetical protein